MSGNPRIGRYLEELRSAIAALADQPIDAIVEILERARAEQRTVFAFGNGGSATTAAHVACDLAKNTRSPGRPGLRMVCLAAESGTLTAYANDEGYVSSFAEPLRALARPGDVAIAISAGGNSPNVVRALELARELELRTIGLTGRDGGKVSQLVDVCLRAAGASIEQTEDVHLVVNHLLTISLRGGDMVSPR